jgi:hypothetical protein
MKFALIWDICGGPHVSKGGTSNPTCNALTLLRARTKKCENRRTLEQPVRSGQVLIRQAVTDGSGVLSLLHCLNLSYTSPVVGRWRCRTAGICGLGRPRYKIDSDAVGCRQIQGEIIFHIDVPGPEPQEL